ncbi:MULTISPECIES: CCA tRNA nucleotidyltransferase [Paenibacillus]|uniref:CCA tRNA nucleotidyltransferase n=1 Tax=Paenibacillus residui TaxID=629724 RepID=A0ABW3D645_9BACL|nr:CCA tRNA nucleotidyltransferase [Aneurinibacillus sp. XH2]
MIPLEPEAVYVLNRLKENGYEAYVVGGYVRDQLRGQPTNDIDIATSALPEQTMALFERTVPTGLQHGTVMVLYGGKSYEVTTFRTESDYENYRRPQEVTFVQNLEQDLQRRDFTINAMAMDGTGSVIDPFGGLEDLQNGLIRCVGDARERFREDALRMVRCVRFAANYRFRIESSTWESLIANRDLLQHIAMERIRAEWDKMMEGSDPYRGLVLLVNSGLLHFLKRKPDWPVIRWTAEEELPAELSLLNLLDRPLLRWAWLLRSMELSAEAARQGLSMLTFSRLAIDKVIKLIEMDGHLIAKSADPGQEELEQVWKEAVLRYGADAAAEWLALADAAAAGRLRNPPLAIGPAWSSVPADEGRRWLKEMPVTGIRELAVSGSDLLTLTSRQGGPWLGRVMDRLMLEVALGRCANRKEDLLDKAKYYLANE